MSNINQSPSISDLLIATLRSARSVKSFRAILRERAIKRHKKNSVQTTLSRLQRRGYARHNIYGWILTQKGQVKVRDRKLLSYISSPFKERIANSVILAFDIPEKNRKLRNWLRNQIKIFGYKILQQSLWIGPGPLPEVFMKRLEYMKIRQNIKIFKIKHQRKSILYTLDGRQKC